MMGRGERWAPLGSAVLLGPGLAILLAARAAPAAEPADLAALLTAHAAALGVAPGAAGPGLEISGEVEGAGQSGRFRLVVVPPGMHRLDVDLGPLSERSGFDGRTAWICDVNGVTRRLHLGEMDESILRGAFFARAYVAATLPLYADSLRLAVRPPDAGDDESEFVLALHPGRGLAVDLDRKTHLATAAVWRDAGGETRLTLRDYRPVGAVLVPHRMDRAQPGGLEERYRVTSARVLASAPDSSAFAPPASRRNVTFDPDGAVVAPLRMVGQHVFVEAAINGRPAGLFFLDTGAGANCVNERVARELGLTVAGDITATGTGGSTRTEYRQVDALAVGGVRMGEHVVVALDLEPIEKVMGLAIGGIVGYDFLNQVVFGLDYEAGTLTMHDPATFVPPGLAPAAAESGALAAPAGGREVEFLVGKNTPLLSGTVEERAGGWFRVDSGAGDFVSLHGPFVRAHDLLAGRPTEESKAMGIGGTQRMYVGKLASCTIAGERFTGVDASFTLAEEGALADEDIAGIVGGQFLRQVALTFDYRRERAYLARRDGAVERGFGFGARLDGDRLVVTDVKPDRPAAGAGLRPGDRIVSVRGAPVGREQILDIATIFRFAPDEERVEMVVERDGATLPLALAKPAH
jgi:hypothetical protein